MGKERGTKKLRKEGKKYTGAETEADFPNGGKKGKKQCE